MNSPEISLRDRLLSSTEMPDGQHVYDNPAGPAAVKFLEMVAQYVGEAKRNLEQVHAPEWPANPVLDAQINLFNLHDRLRSAGFDKG